MCLNSPTLPFRHRHSYLVSLLFAAPIPTLVIFMKFLPLVIYTTSGKNFIKITSVGMGAAKSNETR